MSLALSTSWNASRYTNGKELLFEIEKTGFKELELSFNLTLSMVKEIAALKGERGIKILSTHNYCPIPEGVIRQDALPDCFSMASVDEEERNLAIKFTKVTIDTASALGAKAVVLHCGRVETEDKTRQLISLCEKGQKDSEEFKKIRDGAALERKEKAALFFGNTLKSLDELNKHAERKNISLGVENRFYLREIPSIEEIGVVLNKFSGGQIFYWHDTGHARLMENLGFSKQDEFLNLYHEKMLGIHLHDILCCEDHLPPGKGQLDFRCINRFLKKSTLKVIEAHAPATVEEIKESKQLLEKILGENV